MPSTALSIFAAAGLAPEGVLPWRTRLPFDEPGVYLIARTAEADSVAAPEAFPVSASAVQELLDARPELRVDGQRPDQATLAARLAEGWLSDETTLYIGLAGTSLARRVADYYSTPLGARRPHAGGWPLKTLATLNDLSVHFARCADPAAAEDTMLGAFVRGVSPSVRATLGDPSLPIPFANLEWPKGTRKRHGITGAREPAKPQAPRGLRKSAHDPPAPIVPGSKSSSGASSRTQRMTAKDVDAGQIRVPAATKVFFPNERTEVTVALRGTRFQARWDPRNGPDRARSGVLRFGAGKLDRLVSENETLSVSRSANGVIEIA